MRDAWKGNIGPTGDRPAVSPPTLHRLLYWSGVILVAASWLSSACFGLYILRFYLGAAAAGKLSRWNDHLAGLYDAHFWWALVAMGAHLATGAILLLLGPVQLIASVRRRWPAMHRWLGRLYVLTAAIAGLGGLVFILSKGTIGGGPMNLGFGLYGFLVVLAAAETYRHGRARRLEAHRAWALRLFALATGSWLYRMVYGFWLLFLHGRGHRPHDFRGPFDIAMAFAFYLPNLALVEFYLRARQWPSGSASRLGVALVLNLATAFVLVGTYFFLRSTWGPAILHGAS